ncbi:[FeFe] hydrogenase H-cluster radical SAM maturase HydE [Thomasclavelia cocleata]|uniref:[FeFe] hydrogenase H-cluster radical SAM maturase HydE n=1 Tax=Thomasclavelia cocleata TaxID=69824 RepID=UPI00242F5909|nr:[FeFe] hydrogenase H-cluster radical SAM maturase HydE [Thomasclavelia cocleata]
MENIELINKLNYSGELDFEEFKHLLSTYDQKDFEYAKELAAKITKKIFGNKIYIRGLIEISSYCKNDCYYCGLRRSNLKAVRYRLNKDEILFSCKEGYKLGFRTFVLQGGEDLYYQDELMVDIIKSIRQLYPDCAITLSLGEKSKETYKKYYDAGANRYLLRHETYNEDHYYMLHPHSMSFKKRIECLHNLKEIGFQTGCGFMVGSYHQTIDHLVNDLLFIKELKPEMVGVGPYLVHHDTPFKDLKNGKLNQTLFILSIIRIMTKDVLLPATTALATLDSNGRIEGIKHGCNVVMPNLSPQEVREKYLLYDNKAIIGQEASEGLKELIETLRYNGYEVVYQRGDYCKFDYKG